MRGHQVGHHELLQAALGVRLFEQLHEALVDRVLRLAHHAEHRIGDMLGRHAQLSAHVVRAQLAHEGAPAVLVGQRKVEPDARPDEHLLHARQFSQFAQQRQVIRVVGIELATRRRREAMLVAACPATQLRLARRGSIIGRRPAHVVDIPLEFGVGNHLLRLFNDGLVAAHLHDAPLMERQRAKRAFAEAPAVAGQAELHLADGGHAAGLVVHRVAGTRVRQAIHRVHFRSGQGLRRRVLHHEFMIGIGLHQALARERVAVAVLHVEAFRVVEAVVAHGVEAGQQLVIVDMLERFRPHHRSVDERDVVDGKARGKRVGHLHDGVLPHAVAEQVGA